MNSIRCRNFNSSPVMEFADSGCPICDSRIRRNLPDIAPAHQLCILSLLYGSESALENFGSRHGGREQYCFVAFNFNNNVLNTSKHTAGPASFIQQPRQPYGGVPIQRLFTSSHVFLPQNPQMSCCLTPQKNSRATRTMWAMRNLVRGCRYPLQRFHEGMQPTVCSGVAQ